MDAEAAVSILLPVVKTMSEAVTRYGGTITHRMGDGLMGVFGVPTIQEDHAIRACHAALALLSEVARTSADFKRRHGFDIQVRVGLNSGPVVLATSVESGHLSYDALGPTTHLASRMETAAEPGTIALSDHTARLVRHLFRCKPIGQKALKGFKQPQYVHLLLRPIDLRSSDYGPGTINVHSPLVGREREIGEISASFEALNRGEGSFILISGEPGIGKTRLLAEAKQSLKGGVTWLEGHAISFGQRLSYWPFVEMLKPFLGIHEILDDNESWRRVQHRLAEVMGADASEYLPYVAVLLGLDVREPYTELVSNLDAESLGAQIMRAGWHLFEQLAKGAPVVIAIEDLHWVDGSSVAFLEHLLPLASRAPIVICATSRPDSEIPRRLKNAADGFPGLHMTEISLLPLPVRDSQRLIGNIIDDQADTSRIRDLILYKAEGNPFFTQELIKTLVDSKILVHGESGWIARDEEIALPDTVDGVIMARIDRLDDRLKQVLATASVIGRRFLHRVLQAVTEQSNDLEDRLTRLKAVEIIDEARRTPELAYLFHHALVQEAVYESILIERRKSIHARVAEFLEALYGDHAREMASLLAFHYARAEKYDNALKYLLLAAEQSNRMAADDEALLHYEEAVRAYGRVSGTNWDKDQRAAIEYHLGVIYLRRSDHAQALAHLTNALSIYGEHIPQSRAAVLIAIAREFAVQVVHRLAPRPAQRRADASVDPSKLMLVRADEALAWTMSMLDHLRTVCIAFRSLNLAEKFAIAEGIAKGSAGFGWGLDCLGFNSLALHYYQRAMEVAEQINNPSILGWVWNLMAAHDYIIGRWRESGERFDKSRDFLARSGDLVTWTSACVQRGLLMTEIGEFAPALKIADEMMALGQESALPSALRYGVSIRGVALRRLGRLDECEPVLRQIQEIAIKSPDFLAIGHMLGEFATFLIQRGHFDEAVSVIEQCHRVFRVHPILAHTRIYPEIAMAFLTIQIAERSSEGDGAVRQKMLRACRATYRMSRRYRSALPATTRMMGTAEWIIGRSAKAEKWWQRSLSVAMKYGTKYHAGLTCVERSRRTGSADDMARGMSLLAETGIEADNLSNVSIT